jgi:hypothetical protein
MAQKKEIKPTNHPKLNLFIIRTSYFFLKRKPALGIASVRPKAAPFLSYKRAAKTTRTFPESFNNYEGGCQHKSVAEVSMKQSNPSLNSKRFCVTYQCTRQERIRS